jgi:hypothetical protein
VDGIGGCVLDDNDPDAARGTGSFSITWNGTNSPAYFQFDIGTAVLNRPRDIPAFGNAVNLRFFAKGDAASRTLEVNIYRQGQQGPIATEWFLLTTSWTDYALSIPSGIRPQDLLAVQYLMDSSQDPGGGSAKLDDIRIDTRGSPGYDRLRDIQSYIANWAPDNSPPNTPQFRDNQM